MIKSRSRYALVGTYTDEGGPGLVSYEIGDEWDIIREIDTVSEQNPSFFDYAPGESIVVAVNETDSGGIVSYELDRAHGRLTFKDRAATTDSGPCHVTIDPAREFVIVSHYTGGSVTLHSIDTDGNLSAPLDNREHHGSSRNTDRQAAPHPHSANFISGDVILVPDLGTDKVHVYELDRKANRLRAPATPHVTVPPGSGPRHFDSHPSRPVGYCLNELSSTVTVFDTTDPIEPEPICTVSTLPSGTDTESVISADIHVTRDGKFLFASNRGHDSLTTFRIGSTLHDIERTSVDQSGGECPRNFAIDPSGRRLYVCNQHSNSIQPFSIDKDSGSISSISDDISITAPVCLLFV